MAHCGRIGRVTPSPELFARWSALLPNRPGLGERLLERWSQPHRDHHGPAHLLEVLQAVDLLGHEADDPEAVCLAAWFHDAVHDGRPDDEARSAALAVRELSVGGADAGLVEHVRSLVLMTREHDPHDPDGCVLSDADLSVLAAPAARYAAYVRGVRAEYAHVQEVAFRRGRADVLRTLLGRPRLFRTRTGHDRWEAAARAQVARELAALTSGR